MRLQGSSTLKQEWLKEQGWKRKGGREQDLAMIRDVKDKKSGVVERRANMVTDLFSGELILALPTPDSRRQDKSKVKLPSEWDNGLGYPMYGETWREVCHWTLVPVHHRLLLWCILTFELTRG